MKKIPIRRAPLGALLLCAPLANACDLCSVYTAGMATDAIHAGDTTPGFDDPASQEPFGSHLERIEALPTLGPRVRTALRIRRGIDGCVDALLTLANRLRDGRMSGTRLAWLPHAYCDSGDARNALPCAM